jgi:hypothetical protein
MLVVVALQLIEIDVPRMLVRTPYEADLIEDNDIRAKKTKYRKASDDSIVIIVLEKRT